MGIIFIIIFVSIYIYQFNYYRKNELPYTTLILSLILNTIVIFTPLYNIITYITLFFKNFII